MKFYICRVVLVVLFLVKGVYSYAVTEGLARYQYTGTLEEIGFKADATLGHVINIQPSTEVDKVTPANNYAARSWTTSNNLDTGNYLDFGFDQINESTVVQKLSIALSRDSLGPRKFQIDLLIDDVLHSTLAVPQPLNETTTYITSIVPDPLVFADNSIIFRVYAWDAVTAEGRLYLQRLNITPNPLSTSIIIEGENFEVTPYVESFTPLSATTISTSQTIAIEFSEEVITTGDFAELDCMIQGDNQFYNVNFVNGGTEVSGTNIVITPSSSLINDDVCELTLIHSFIEDLRGNVLRDHVPPVPTGTVDEYAIYFTPNFWSPFIVSSNPIEGQRITITQDLTVKYSEPVLTPVDVEDENDGHLFSNITCDSNTIPFTYKMLKYDNVGTALTFRPISPLPFGANCRLDLTGLLNITEPPETFTSSSINFSTTGEEAYMLIPIINGLVL